MPDRRGRVVESDLQWVRTRRQRLMRDPKGAEHRAFADVPKEWARRVVVIDHGRRLDKLSGEGVLRWAVAAPTLPAIKAGLLRWGSKLNTTPEPDMGGLFTIRRLGPAR